MISNAFKGIEQLYGDRGFKRIQESHFLVVGIGGVGSWICEALVRSGAMEITIVDLDEICISNINRQVHSLVSNVGKSKVDEMKKRLLEINPELKVHAILDFFTEKTASDILSNKYTYVFDGIDSLKNKCLLLVECQKRSIPVICSGGAGGKVDPTQIDITDLNRTINDQLLFRVKRVLKKEYGYPKYPKKPFKIPAVYSKEDPLTGQAGERNDCTSFGSVSFVTASFAFSMVSFVISEITSE